MNLIQKLLMTVHLHKEISKHKHCELLPTHWPKHFL